MVPILLTKGGRMTRAVGDKIVAAWRRRLERFARP